jgi:hypothetical protein
MLAAGIGYSARAALRREQCDVHAVGLRDQREERVALATDTHAIMEGTVVFYGICSEATMVLSQEVFSVGYVLRLYNSDTRDTQ